MRRVPFLSRPLSSPTLRTLVACSVISSLTPGLPTQVQAQTQENPSVGLPLPATLPTSQAPSPTSSETNAKYIVGPDDVLSVTVLKHPEFSIASAIVPERGEISVPVVGAVKVSGKSLQQIDEEITAKFRVRLRRPEVSVSVDKPRPRSIYIVGQVKNPGIYETKDSWRITQALAAAGGLSVQTDLASVIVSRNNKKLLDTSLLPLLKNPTDPGNLSIKSGDTLRFYERKVTVSVTGAVTNPGTYSVPTGNGVAQAIGLAGGPANSAALTRATIRHANGKTLAVNLYKALIENDAESNVPLVEGDVIIVPEQKDRVSIQGSVEKPGFIPIEDGRPLTVIDAIAAVGGPKDNAALTHATLRHADGTQQSVNLYSLLVLGDQSNNIKLRPNDLISIPEARGITVIGEVTRPGTYPLEEGKEPRVSDALAAAGGLSIKPEQARISISRREPGQDLKVISVDAVSISELSDPTQNNLLRDGDIISVAALKQATIFVSGEVKTPGAYQISEGDGVAELVTRAGGPTPDAALSKVAVTRRDGTQVMVDASVALLKGSRRIGGPLNDGDIVVVPRSEKRILVVGAVSKAGSYALPEDRPLTVGDALSLAGGTASLAKVKSLTLLRPNGDAVTREVLDISDSKNGQLNVNKVMLSGDVLYVPEGKPSPSTLTTIASFLPGVGLLLR